MSAISILGDVRVGVVVPASARPPLVKQDLQSGLLRVSLRESGDVLYGDIFGRIQRANGIERRPLPLDAERCIVEFGRREGGKDVGDEACIER